MKKQIVTFLFLLLAALFIPLTQALAMPVGTLLYRTSGDNKMYGYNVSDLIVAEKGKLAHIYSGHSAIYVGQENGIDYIVEMQPKGAIKVPAKYFVNEAQGEKFIGAKIPINASPLQIAKAVSIAKNLASNNMAYDFDFKYQKGPKNSQWTCVGLNEKIYESANISNPTNLNSLEYNSDYYAVDITPDGYDNQSIYNSSGDCFASTLEYSKIERKKNMLIPAPELIGYDVGLEHDGNRYIFLPYTQYLQSSLKDVVVDIPLSSSFSEPEVRGNSPLLGLILKWSLINNPISTVKNLATKAVDGLVAIKEKVFPDNSVALANNSTDYTFGSSSASSSKATSTAKVVVPKTTATKATSTVKAVIPNVTVAKVTSTTAKTINEIVASKATTTTIVRTTPKPVITVVSSTPIIHVTTTTPVIVNPVIHSTSTIVTTTPEIVVTPVATTTATSTEIILEVVEPETPIALIAKIYSNGDDDWLELVNTTNTDFDLAEAGYRLEKAKTASDPTLIMRFGDEADGVYPGGTIIPAHGSYLVARDTSSEEIKARADAISTRETFSWTEDSYTLYLGTAAISSDIDIDIVDKLGYGTAQFFSGTAPASALKKGYALERKANATSTIELLVSGGLEEFWPRLFNSNDNSSDFLLVPYDLAAIEADNPETDNEPINSDIFVNPAGLNSADLTQLWHFDECYGEVAANELQESGQSPVDFIRSNNWLPGKWGCAASLSKNYSKGTKATFVSPLNTNQFTLNFYYKNNEGNFGLILNFSNPVVSGRIAYIELSPYYTTIYGLPGAPGRINDLVWPVDYLWHQVTVVIDQASGYWSMYRDGQEVYRYEFSGAMPTFEYFELSNNQNEAIAVDELSMWNRALPIGEVKTINLLNQPFNPYTWPEAQKEAKLERYWSFDENSGYVTKDSIVNDQIFLMSGQWSLEGISNSGLAVGPSLSSMVSNLPISDLSLSFWWKNSSYPNEGRLNLSFAGINGNIISLKPTIYNPSFGFNNLGGGLIADDGQNMFPNDNKWHYLVLTYDAHRLLLKFYLDGEKRMEQPFIRLRTTEKITSFNVLQENWPSLIDELKIWSGTLTAAQILAEYDALK